MGKPKARPASSVEARENQMISLAVDLAEKKLRDGTASSQLITEYIKMGSTNQRLKKELMEKEKELAEAKIESLKAAKRTEELYADAIAAMKKYSGVEDDDEDSDIF